MPNAQCLQGCADCCGVFDHILLTKDEYNLSKDMTPNVATINGQHFLKVTGGCTFLTDRKCSIYEKRPQTCRNYFCNHALNNTALHRHFRRKKDGK